MSRATDLGVKPAQLKRATLSRIKKSKALMVELAGLWGDVDEAMVIEADTMADRLVEMETSLDASIVPLREEWPERTTPAANRSPPPSSFWGRRPPSSTKSPLARLKPSRTCRKAFRRASAGR